MVLFCQCVAMPIVAVPILMTLALYAFLWYGVSMLLNLPIRGVGIKWLIVCLFLIFPLSGTVFGQTPTLVLDSTDIRMDHGLYNGVAGFDIFIRKKPGIESVMLTEPSGAHALRATAWNPVNGNERRAISGVIITGAYSQYSIVSSTPQPDEQFGSAFHLFIPSVVIYGNPTSPIGTVYHDIDTASRINIRTFDQKYADPNRSRFQNNHYTIGVLLGSRPLPTYIPPEDLDRISIVRDYLQEILGYNKFLYALDNDSLKQFLIRTFREKDSEK